MTYGVHVFSQAQNISDIGNLKCHGVYYLIPEDERVKKNEGIVEDGWNTNILLQSALCSRRHLDHQFVK